MNEIEARGSRRGRPNRVVSLPCGHQVAVDLDASLIGLSGPVLDHQSTCRNARVSAGAWFPLGPRTAGDVGWFIKHPF